MNWRICCSVVFTALLASCGGGGGSGGGPGVSPPATGLDDVNVRLTVADVKKVLAQAIDQASALGVNATIAVVDRVGNVLALYQMAGGNSGLFVSTDFPNTILTGLDGTDLRRSPARGIPAGAELAGAISKAVTGAYLSSQGNAFTTRSANQIVQEHFNPGEDNQPAGPLFGVQFSQFPCSDFVTKFNGIGPSVGPQRSPLGLAADPGGIALYKSGTPVGGIGVIADARYSIDRNIMNSDRDVDEMVALAGTFDFGAPTDRRADRVTVDGKTFRYTDVDFNDLPVSPEQAPDFDSLTGAVGSLVALPGYSTNTISQGTIFGQPGSGVRAATSFNSALDSFVFVDENNQNRYPPIRGTDGATLTGGPLSANESRQILASAIGVANRARAQIRRPLNSPARVTVSLVDSQGEILGILRTRDAPMFGSDVSLQKARTAAFFSSPDAGVFLRGITTPVAYFQNPTPPVLIGDYVTAAKAFIGPDALSDGTAFSDRAGGNLSRPFYPDGIEANVHGPFGKSFRNNEWSVFSTGLQLDLVYNKVFQHVASLLGLAPPLAEGDTCTNSPGNRLANGIQIFPGSVPVYRGGELVGGLGISGDGIDQDDMIAFLGVHEAGLALGGSINNAPPEIRADNLLPQGERLRYVQCPQTPFIDSDEQNVCQGK